MSLPAVLLWRLLKGQPQGVKFRREHPSSKAGFDFYCLDARLEIEVDFTRFGPEQGLLRLAEDYPNPLNT